MTTRAPTNQTQARLFHNNFQYGTNNVSTPFHNFQYSTNNMAQCAWLGVISNPRCPNTPPTHQSPPQSQHKFHALYFIALLCQLQFTFSLSFFFSPTVKSGVGIVRPSHCGLFMKYLGEIVSKLGIELQSSLNTDISSKNSKEFVLNTVVLSCMEMQTTNY